jgi:hypothetical protein
MHVYSCWCNGTTTLQKRQHDVHLLQLQGEGYMKRMCAEIVLARPHCRMYERLACGLSVVFQALQQQQHHSRISALRAADRNQRLTHGQRCTSHYRLPAGARRSCMAPAGHASSHPAHVHAWRHDAVTHQAV